MPSRTQITRHDCVEGWSAIGQWTGVQLGNVLELVKPQPAARFVPHFRAAHRFLELPLDEVAALQVGRLPALHKDPFDRMLVCQAIAHGLAIVTPDPLIAQYPVRTVW